MANGTADNQGKRDDDQRTTSQTRALLTETIEANVAWIRGISLPYRVRQELRGTKVLRSAAGTSETRRMRAGGRWRYGRLRRSYAPVLPWAGVHNIGGDV